MYFERMCGQKKGLKNWACNIFSISHEGSFTHFLSLLTKHKMVQRHYIPALKQVPQLWGLESLLYLFGQEEVSDPTSVPAQGDIVFILPPRCPLGLLMNIRHTLDISPNEASHHIPLFSYCVHWLTAVGSYWKFFLLLKNKDIGILECWFKLSSNHNEVPPNVLNIFRCYAASLLPTFTHRDWPHSQNLQI